MRELERRLEGEQKLEWRCQGNMRKEVWRRKVLFYAILVLSRKDRQGVAGVVLTLLCAVFTQHSQSGCLFSPSWL